MDLLLLKMLANIDVTHSAGQDNTVASFLSDQTATFCVLVNKLKVKTNMLCCAAALFLFLKRQFFLQHKL